MKYCIECGKKQNAGGKFCPECGFSINKSNEKSPEQGNKEESVANADFSLSAKDAYIEGQDEAVTLGSIAGTQDGEEVHRRNPSKFAREIKNLTKQELAVKLARDMKFKGSTDVDGK
tara:strand:+ start:24699 stop:25049 length:351 start_codon:yes stop_codon:yes gene_type:complete